MSNVHEARTRSKSISEEIGFPADQVEEISLAVSELATNLVKHAGGGMLSISGISTHEKRGVTIVSSDHGPGIRDLNEAMTDGFSTSGSLGCGLGAVNRIMDELDIAPHRDSQRGLIVTCTKWLRGNSKIIKLSIDIGAASRPIPGSVKNGDDFVIRKWGSNALVAVIDGLGHGQYAHRAAKSAKIYIEDHYDEPLKSMFLRVGYACRATRGVVMSIAMFNDEEKRVYYGSIGNVEARIIGRNKPASFIVRRGIVGKKAPMPEITEHEWSDADIMVIYTDGITSHWEWKDFIYCADRPAQVIAGEMLRKLARTNDDATVAVIKKGIHENKGC